MSQLNKHMKPSIKTILIFNELKKYNSEIFAEKEILNAKKDLIKYSKQDYVAKDFTLNVNNNNVVPLDKVFTDNNIYKKERHLLSYEEEDYLLEAENRDFNILNKAA